MYIILWGSRLLLNPGLTLGDVRVLEALTAAAPNS